LTLKHGKIKLIHIEKFNPYKVNKVPIKLRVDGILLNFDLNKVKDWKKEKITKCYEVNRDSSLKDLESWRK